jgi:hypothetical protein
MPTGRTAADVVIETTAYDQAIANERIASLESDLEAVTFTLRQALQALHDVTVECDRLRRALRGARRG